MLTRVISSLVFLFAVPVSAEVIPGSQIAFGNWSGAAYRLDSGGPFSHCAISAHYLSGFRLLFSVNSDASVTVGLAAADLGTTPGDTFDATLTIDRRARFSGTAVAMSDDLVIFNIADMDKALEALRKGRVLTVRSGEFRQDFNLTGTFRALDNVLDCAVTYYGLDQRDARNGNPESRPQAADKTVLFQLATSMISDAGVSDFRYLSQTELGELDMPDAVIWISEPDNLMGGVTLTDVRPEVDLRRTSAEAAHGLSSSCAGDAATSSTDASVGGLPAREIRVVCKAADGLHETILTQVVIDDVLLETFFTFGGEASPDRKAARDAMPASATLRAASLVREIRE